jgi:hypothetical protein
MILTQYQFMCVLSPHLNHNFHHALEVNLIQGFLFVLSRIPIQSLACATQSNANTRTAYIHTQRMEMEVELRRTSHFLLEFLPIAKENKEESQSQSHFPERFDR